MDGKLGSSKCRLEDVTDTTGQELRVRELERKWRMVSGWCGADGHQRSGTDRGGSREKLWQ